MFFNRFLKPKVITRIAPSPTGNLHVGTARTALFNYCFAKNQGGELRLRIEDTDKERSTKEYEENIIAGLRALGVAWSGDIVRQSERGDVYTKHLKAMLENGSAYEAEENKDKTGKVIRFKNPNKKITFADEVRGEITFDTEELGDFVIARDINTPLYHLAVVVDDFEMGVTHVIRGEDGISNTPRQILIQEAIGASRPVYAHLPLILAADKSKMSKRHGATAISEYIARGYLPEALVNFLAKLGWSDGTDRELYTMDELVGKFSLSGVQKGGAVFNEEKLLWFNKEYMKSISDDVFLDTFITLLPADAITDVVRTRLERALPTIRERTALWSDAQKDIQEGEWEYLFTAPELDSTSLVWKDETKDATKRRLEHIDKQLRALKTWDAVMVKDHIWEYAEQEGRGEVLWPLRYGLTGREKSADPFTVAEILGKEETLTRIQNAIIALNA